MEELNGKEKFKQKKKSSSRKGKAEVEKRIR